MLVIAWCRSSKQVGPSLSPPVVLLCIRVCLRFLCSPGSSVPRTHLLFPCLLVRTVLLFVLCVALSFFLILSNYITAVAFFFFFEGMQMRNRRIRIRAHLRKREEAETTDTKHKPKFPLALEMSFACLQCCSIFFFFSSSLTTVLSSVFFPISFTHMLFFLFVFIYKQFFFFVVVPKHLHLICSFSRPIIKKKKG